MKAKTMLVMLALTLVAFALRVYRLDFLSLRGDEAFTVIFVQRTWEGLWRGISTLEPNPPLMYLALRGWIALAGASEFVTRYFSVWFGVLCVPLVYRLAREIFASRVIALTAAALITINPYQIWHSQDVRNYTMWPALSLLALIFFWRWWRAETTDDRRPTTDLRFAFYALLCYVLATLTSLYTHYYDVFILAALNLFVFLFAGVARRWQTLARWISAQVVLVLLYAPWVLFGTNRITTYQAIGDKGISLLQVLGRTLASFVLSDTVPEEFKTTLGLPLALIGFGVLLVLWRQQRMLATFLGLWIAIPTLAQYIVSLGRPLFLERYLNVIAPAYYVTFAIGLWQLSQLDVSRFLPHGSRLAPHASRLALLIGLVFFAALAAPALHNHYFDPAYAKAPNWRALMQYIKDHREEGDFVIQNFTDMSPYYYRGDLPVMTMPKNWQAKPADEKLLQQLSNDYRRLWFIPATPGEWWDSEQFVERFLSHYNERAAEIPIDIFRLQLYLTPREFQSKMIPAHARVGNAMLASYRVDGNRPLRIVLIWRADQRIEKNYTVFLHLADANQRVVAQQDRAPAFGLYPTTAWQPGESVVDAYDLAIDAPGTYTLIVGMYDPPTNARVPAFDTNGNRLPEDRIILTQLTIP